MTSTSDAKEEEKAVPITTILFDIDNTMYPRSCGLEAAMTKRILEYVTQKVNVRHAVEQLEREESENPLGQSGIFLDSIKKSDEKQEEDDDDGGPPPSPEVIDKLLYTYYQKYGITLNGLIKNHNVDVKDYLEYVHEPSQHIENFLPPASSAMRTLITSIQQEDPSLPNPELWVFSNAYHVHALRVLDYFNVRDCFKGIVDYETLRHECKPFKKSFSIFLSLLSKPTRPEECLFFDDTPKNLQSAKEMGFRTVLVSVAEEDIPTISSKYPFVEYAVKDFYDIPSVLKHFGLKLADGVTLPPPFLTSNSS